MLGEDAKNIVFYCQHLLGVGHLTRSLAICSSLSEKFKTTFIQGGPDVGKTLNSSNFNHIYLPPLLMREDNSQLYDPAEKNSVEELFDKRKSLLETQAKSKIDCLIIELFPFGRNKFK